MRSNGATECGLSFGRLVRTRPFKFLLTLVLVALLGMGAAFGYYYRAINQPLDFGEQTWVIKRGDTLGQIASQLVQQNIIEETLSLRLLARKDDLSRQVRSGEYRFPYGITLEQFLHHIVSGKSQVGIKVTIIEGWTFNQMRARLQQSPKLRQVTAEMSSQQLMAELGYPDLHPEGQFFPDTYHYNAGQTDLSIYHKAFQLMQEKLEFAWQHRAENLMLKSKDEALILASIIEKESQATEEQAMIAGVFHNRLVKGMRLQTDPTVIYGLGLEYDGDITRSHLKTDTPYNTYTRYGLTPTPISLPGMSSLEAAVRPAATDAYYFVAKGGGLHQFSRTLKQHNRAVKKYILERKSG